MSASPRSRPSVVVIGGGFAGLQAVRALKGADADVLLLHRAPYTTFQPLLYEVATGGLNPGDITYVLRAFAGKHANARFRRVGVVNINASRQTVALDDGDEVAYDYLIVGCGVGASYFGIPGAAENSVNVYRPGAAVEVRDRLIANIEVVAEGYPQAVEPVIVIVGAGPTGVELAGALAGLRNSPGMTPCSLRRRARRCSPRRPPSHRCASSPHAGRRRHLTGSINGSPSYQHINPYEGSAHAQLGSRSLGTDPQGTPIPPAERLGGLVGCDRDLRHRELPLASGAGCCAGSDLIRAFSNATRVPPEEAPKSMMSEVRPTLLRARSTP